MARTVRRRENEGGGSEGRTQDRNRVQVLSLGEVAAGYDDGQIKGRRGRTKIEKKKRDRLTDLEKEYRSVQRIAMLPQIFFVVVEVVAVVMVVAFIVVAVWMHLYPH